MKLATLRSATLPFGQRTSFRCIYNLPIPACQVLSVTLGAGSARPEPSPHCTDPTAGLDNPIGQSQGCILGDNGAECSPSTRQVPGHHRSGLGHRRVAGDGSHEAVFSRPGAATRGYHLQKQARGILFPCCHLPGGKRAANVGSVGDIFTDQAIGRRLSVVGCLFCNVANGQPAFRLEQLTTDD